MIERLLLSGRELHETPDLHGRALELASRLNQGAVYDAHYRALAETLESPSSLLPDLLGDSDALFIGT